MNGYPYCSELRGARLAAGISKHFMGGVNGGGLNSFLTNSYELDSQQVLDALRAIGAVKAAADLAHVLDILGTPLLKSSQDERWHLLETIWVDELNAYECFADTTEAELRGALERHVRENKEFYLGLSGDRDEKGRLFA